jgi:serine protease Do
MNTAIFSPSGGSVGIGFAIPSKIVREVTDQLLDKGRVIRGWIGVTAQNLDDQLPKRFATDKKGALISDLRPLGPASKAQLKVGDIIKSFDHTTITDSPSLKTQVARTRAGRSIDIEYLRDGKPGNTQLVIVEQPQNSAAEQAGKVAPESKRQLQSATDLGLTLQNLPGDLRALMTLPAKEGVLIAQVAPGSLAATAGLTAGDVLLQVERESTQTSEEATRRIGKWLRTERQVDALLLLIQRTPGDRVFIAVPRSES